MTQADQLWLAMTLVKEASALDTALAGAAGMAGPIGTYTYGKLVEPDEDLRYDLIGRSALGSSIGGLTGTALGIPISMATGIPMLPGMVAGGLLGMAGGGAAAALARSRQKRKRDLKRMRERRDPEGKEKA